MKEQLNSKFKAAELKKVLPLLNESINALAEADVPNQEDLIMDSLQVMSEIQEVIELREHVLKMDRTAITILVGMKKPPATVAKVMEAAAIMLGMEAARTVEMPRPSSPFPLTVQMDRGSDGLATQKFMHYKFMAAQKYMAEQNWDPEELD